MNQELIILQHLESLCKVVEGQLKRERYMQIALMILGVAVIMTDVAILFLGRHK